MKTDTQETDAVREMWFIKPNVELGDGRPIHGNVVDVEFARRMERERNEARAFIKRQQDALKTTLPWLTPCAVMAEVEKCIWIADEFAEHGSTPNEEWIRMVADEANRRGITSLNIEYKKP